MNEKMLPELEMLEKMLSSAHSAILRDFTLDVLEAKGSRYPLRAVALGSDRPDAPVFAIIGGIHGLERIGSQVVLSYLNSLLERLSWSKALQRQLEKVRILVVPVMNPVGVAFGIRANGNGVDLMRNAPIESPHALPFFGGHRLGPRLLYYRGPENQPMERELQALQSFFDKNTSASPAVLSLDVHSGFGGMDRVWFPFAKEPSPFPLLPETAALLESFEAAFPNHLYRFEPQSTSYCTHGDFWDYLFERFQSPEGAVAGKPRAFLPLTLEMGSWLWMKKNPTQMFSFFGVFDPIKPHRRKRVQRRHLPFLDFLKDAAESFENWACLEDSRRELLMNRALARWYPPKTKS